ncbi:hypothetical protein N7492_006470 [Penicillium capsulatum]|uniref:Ysc84 actin-binding domain-containing protein n=1 Tax=Penicillium capsulatum TaxID=69766 RepID=A0A9W9HY37_9EURO|nr:hypothetical protein N7492_006470 [Penicillium capsulatum]KAJ6116310.1 hypothetical protein N7512_006035 [Penicillium capsulatum]
MADNQSIASSGSDSSKSSRWNLKQMNNPMPASLANECKKAERILESLITPKKSTSGEADLGIPRQILSHAKGLAIFTSFKLGGIGSIRFGSGLIVARLPNGGWSAPSAMATGGIGVGTQIGIELTDFVFVLNSEAAVRTFAQSGSLTLGRNVSVAFGPYGRSAEVGGAVGSKGMVGMFAYSKSRGIFGGKSLEGGMLGERLEANKKMYGTELTARQLLSGNYPPPPEASSLLRLLNSERFQPTTVKMSVADFSTDKPAVSEPPAKGPYPDVAELPADGHNGAPVGVAELPAEDPDNRLPAELDSGPQHGVHEMPAGNQKFVYELDASEPVSRGPKSKGINGL